jgi:hypothetical protein
MARVARAFMDRVILEKLSRTPRLGMRLFDAEMRAAASKGNL